MFVQTVRSHEERSCGFKGDSLINYNTITMLHISSVSNVQMAKGVMIKSTCVWHVPEWTSQSVCRCV